MNGNDMIEIPARNVKVADSADICIVGGSCTGVFAAVRAARLGAKVILVEQQNRFGGVATCGLVGMWHSVYDITGEKQVIGQSKGLGAADAADTDGPGQCTAGIGGNGIFHHGAFSFPMQKKGGGGVTAPRPSGSLGYWS